MVALHLMSHSNKVYLYKGIRTWIKKVEKSAHAEIIVHSGTAFPSNPALRFYKESVRKFIFRGSRMSKT